MTTCLTRFLLDTAATVQDHQVLLALLGTRETEESLDNLDVPVFQEVQVYLEIQEKEVRKEKRERGGLQELVSEVKEVPLGLKGHQASPERDPQVLLALLGLVALQVVRVPQE